MATYIIIMWYVNLNSSKHPIKNDIIGIAQSLKEAEDRMRDYIKNEREDMELRNYEMYDFDIQKWEFGKKEFSDFWTYDEDGVRY